MSDEKMIPASEWREAASDAREWRTGRRTMKAAFKAAAEFLDREAEKAEARERANQLRADGICRCPDCDKAVEREQLREDVREEIDFMEGRMRLGDPRPSEVRHFRVRAAELRDFYRRTFGEEA